VRVCGFACRLDSDVDRFAGDMGDDAVGDDVIIGGHLVRGGSPIVRDTVTARLTNNVDQVGDFDDA